MNDAIGRFWNAIARYQRRYGYWSTRVRFGEIAANVTKSRRA